MRVTVTVPVRVDLDLSLDFLSSMRRPTIKYDLVMSQPEGVSRVADVSVQMGWCRRVAG